MTWPIHSRRIDPINRSAKPFCQGEAGVKAMALTLKVIKGYEVGKGEYIELGACLFSCCGS
jgi:hypothetical protein